MSAASSSSNIESPPAASVPSLPIEEANPKTGNLFTSREQSTLAAMLVVLLLSAATVWWQRGGAAQVEYDDRPRQPLLFLIDINACDWPELAQISGLGETLARRIIDDREEHGGFRDPREILDVKGIGPKKLAELQPYLAPIRPPTPQSEVPGPGSSPLWETP